MTSHTTDIDKNSSRQQELTKKNICRIESGAKEERKPDARKRHDRGVPVDSLI
jgi:hypothetical protein